MAAAVPTMPNPLAQNAGKPVLGNTGVANPNKTAAGSVPTLGNPSVKPNPQTAPLQSAAVQAQQAAQHTAGATTQVPTAQPIATPINTANPAAPPNTSGTTTTSPSTGTSSNPILANNTPAQNSQLQKQLTDIYGKGEGNLLFGLINGLGSSNTAYMQAYEKAMAPINAENLATLNTTLGNSGVSADSSTFAIANADFQSNVSAQEGLQEQQLQQQDASELANITQNMEGAAVKEVSSTWYNDLADVLTGVGGFITNAISAVHGGGQNSINATSAAQSAGQQNLSAIQDYNPQVPTSDTTSGVASTSSGTLPGVSTGESADGTSTDIAQDPLDAFLF